MENGSGNLPQLVVRHQMVRPEDTHASGIVQTGHAIFMNNNYSNYY